MYSLLQRGYPNLYQRNAKYQVSMIVCSHFTERLSKLCIKEMLKLISSEYNCMQSFHRSIGLIVCSLDLSGRGHFRHILVQGHLRLHLIMTGSVCSHRCRCCVSVNGNVDTQVSILGKNHSLPLC